MATILTGLGLRTKEHHSKYKYYRFAVIVMGLARKYCIFYTHSEKKNTNIIYLFIIILCYSRFHIHSINYISSMFCCRTQLRSVFNSTTISFLNNFLIKGPKFKNRLIPWSSCLYLILGWVLFTLLDVYNVDQTKSKQNKGKIFLLKRSSLENVIFYRMSHSEKSSMDYEDLHGMRLYKKLYFIE